VTLRHFLAVVIAAIVSALLTGAFLTYAVFVEMHRARMLSPVGLVVSVAILLGMWAGVVRLWPKRWLAVGQSSPESKGGDGGTAAGLTHELEPTVDIAWSRNTTTVVPVTTVPPQRGSDPGASAVASAVVVGTPRVTRDEAEFVRKGIRYNRWPGEEEVPPEVWGSAVRERDVPGQTLVDETVARRRRARRRRRGRGDLAAPERTGLDPEVIELARKINRKMHRDET